jgi:hypothetical protein
MPNYAEIRPRIDGRTLQITNFIDSLEHLHPKIVNNSFMLK